MWKTVGVSVAGFSHQAADVPCQDYYAYHCTPSSDLIAVISDGAGSAARCVEGAKRICDGLVTSLSELVNKPRASDEQLQAEIRSVVQHSIERVRQEIERIGNGIEHYAATILGVVAGPTGGTLFHIGDGAACVLSTKEDVTPVMSLPENGEYANETFFFTVPDWQEHIRFTAFDDRFDLITLMSDGVTPFALAAGAAGPHWPFFKPLNAYLSSNTVDEATRALKATLERDSIRKITGDDKTILWSLRS